MSKKKSSESKTFTKVELEKLLETQTPRQIAKAYGMCHQTVRNHAKKMGIELLDRSAALKKSYELGRLKPPNNGPMSEEMKQKIGQSVKENWDNQTEEQLASRSEKAKKNWEKKNPVEKEQMAKAAAKAIRKAAKEGSKTELYILEQLQYAGIPAQSHNTHRIANENLELDIYIPSLKTAIEINGVSHYEPIRGEDVLARQQKADKEKAGLLLGSGMCLINIKLLRKHVSQSYHRELFAALLMKLKEIEDNFPPPGKRLIEVYVE